MGTVKRRKYSTQQMEDALAAAREGEAVASAARRFGVPRVTLLDKLKGRVPEVCKLGRKSILSPDEEKILVDWLLHCRKMGFPVSVEQLLFSVGHLLKSLNRPNPFSNKANPSRIWYKLFMKRHPELSERECQTLTTSRASVTIDALTIWFEEVKDHLEEKNLIDVLNQPHRVFNCDETAFYLSPKKGKVIVGRGDRSVHNISGNNEKENISVMLTVSADGKIAPTFVVYSYKRIQNQIIEKFPDSWAIGNSDNGWMTAELFYEYVANIFIKYLDQNNIQRPVILFLDGHASHMTLPLSELCAQNGIELVAFYPNSTHILQPLDVGVFGPLKKAWKKAVDEFRVENNHKKLEKPEFAPLLEKVLKSLNPESVKSGFKSCGLLTLNANDINLTKIVGQDKQKNHQHQTLRPTPAGNQPVVLKQFFHYLNSKLGAKKLAEFEKGKNIARRDESLYSLWQEMRDDLRSLTMETEESHAANDHTPQGNHLEYVANEDGRDALGNQEECVTVVDDALVFNFDPENDLKLPIELDLPVTTIDPQNISVWDTPLIIASNLRDSLTNSITSTPVTPTPSELLQSPDTVTLNCQSITPDTKKMSSNGTSPSIEANKERMTSKKTPEGTCGPQREEDFLTPSDNQTTPIKPPSQAQKTAYNEAKRAMPENINTTNKSPSMTSSYKPSSSITRDDSTPFYAGIPSSSTDNTFNVPDNVPSPFKRTLFWPSENKKKVLKKKKVVKIPAVITSPLWRDYKNKLEEEKIKIEKMREEKRRIRENKIKIKKEKVTEKDKKIPTKNTDKPEAQFSENKEVNKQKLSKNVDSESEEKDVFNIKSFKLNTSLNVQELCPGKWVVVPYPYESGELKYFVGHVLSTNNQNKTSKVKFLTPRQHNKFVWPIKEDVDNKVPFKDIVKILNDPDVDKWGYHTFYD